MLKQFVRYNSGLSQSKYAQDPLKLVVIPITTRKSYVYFKHTASSLNNGSALVRYETKIVNKASQIWSNLKKSPKSYNKKIVFYVEKLLNQIPWTESALKSLPSESYILKQVKQLEDEKHLMVPLKDVDPDTHELKPIHVYYPGSVISEDLILEEIRESVETGLSYHKKQMALCGLGLPLTAPIALVPLFPNVPGFYLAYRLYCNLKAYLGAKHLETLIEHENLSFIDFKEYNQLFSSSETPVARDIQSPESVILSKELLQTVVEQLELEAIKGDLEKAVVQETQRISMNAKKDM